MSARWPWAVAVGLVAALVAPGRARGEGGAVAVLPMTASEPRLELYSRPIAGVVAVGLARATGARVEATPAGTAPSNVVWVIDGRIVARGREVLLEARLRDPARGTTAGTVATGARPLRQVDRLARDLTRDLAALYARAEAERARGPAPAARSSDAPPTPPLATPAISRPVDPVRSTAPRATEPVASAGPRLLLGRLGGRSAGGVAFGALATSEVARLAARLGFTTVDSGLVGLVQPADVALALARHGAHFGLFLEVVDLGFTWRGVLSARGAVRVVVIDRAGRVLVDRLARTDTVVGSRGDRSDALVHLVLAQVLDIVWPELRAALSA